MIHLSKLLLRVAKRCGCRRSFISTVSDLVKKPVCDFKVAKLDHRSLIRLSGPDVNDLLQGLITNDIRQIVAESPSMYTMVLNVKGRVLFDLMLYCDQQSKGSLIAEVDNSQSEQLLKFLKKYKIRKNVKVENMDADLSVYSATGCSHERPDHSEMLVYRDPRLKELGWRLLATDQSLKGCEILNENVYREHRYKLGVGEGPDEHLPDKAIPLECNLAILNGVSFNKGCYIGQELTARSHHTGVIRKRIMPVELDSLA